MERYFYKYQMEEILTCVEVINLDKIVSKRTKKY